MTVSPDQPSAERRHLGPDPDNNEIVAAVVDAVEGVHDEPDPFEAPLYDVIDTEALATLLRHADGRTEPVVSFVVADCTVVASPGSVLARPTEESAARSRDPQALLSELTS